jgi:NAD(P)-dependent dehydrogenase (short-subunit alcohol dehydrogenase family)
MGQLDGRVAIVTGAGVGIGEAIARRYVDEGARVVIAELNPEHGKETEQRLGEGAYFVETNAGDKESVESMVQATLDKWGTVDILVNNAWGGGKIGRVEKKTEAIMEHGVNVGFLGPLWTMIAVHPIMKAKGYGRIINICSLNGVNAHMGTLEYNTSKEALRTATRTAAREWAELGITANVICPAAKSHSFASTMAAHPELVATADASNPMGRIGDCYDDISPVALFLASEGCRYLTGNTLFVDGGSHINGAQGWTPDLD